MFTLKLVALAGVAGAVVVGVLLLTGSLTRAASGPCNTNDTTMSPEETQFLGLLQSWRDANIANSSRLQPSGALNAAAAWFADYQVSKGGLGGHYDNYGRRWYDRAYDCSYTGTTSGGTRFAMGSGEGVYALAASQPLNVGPSEAIAGITYPGSGVYISTPSVSLPAKCVGVAVKRNAGGTAVAWVVVIAQYPANLPCPGSTASGGGTSSPSPGGSSTSAITATQTSTATPTQSPTPPTFRAFAAQVSKDGPR